jgi:hypothetical protein
MANAQASSDRYETATIDTAPAAAGYWTKPVSMSAKRTRALWFDFTNTGTATVTLQFKATGDTGFTDYDTDDVYVAGSRYIIDDSASGTQWRAGVQ